jgi:uncharacterized repeat protein (TIGR02543 family)
MKNTIKLTAVLLLAVTMFFAGCDVGNDIGTNLHGTDSNDNTSTDIDADDTEQSETPKTLDSIRVTPIKTDYFIDEPLDLDGIEVTAIYSDNSEEKVVIDESNVIGFDSSEPKTLTLTVTYNDKIATFEVTIDNVTLRSIEITAEPAKTEYLLYEELDLDGIKVTAVLSDGTREILDTSELETEGFDPEQLGEQTITVSIAGKTAVFTVTVIPQTFTVTFNSNGGNIDANPNTKTVTQPAAGVDSLPTPPTRTGYDFTEWGDGHGNIFTAEYLVTGSITVYAQWVKKTYTVTFNSNGGSAVTNQSVKYEEKASKPAADPAVPAGSAKYVTFGGWYTDNTTFNNKWDFTANTVTDNVTLYAKWRNYEIGDVGPGGGKIFYYSSSGFTVKGSVGTYYYLEASKDDLGSADWGADRDDLSDTQWEIGEGKNNTKLIIEYLNKWGEKNKAAQFVVGYTNNGLSDWFLPSKNELYTLFVNRVAAGVDLKASGSTTNYYWSSSDGSDDKRAWAYSYSGNTITDTDKLRTQSAYVRAIRAF